MRQQVDVQDEPEPGAPAQTSFDGLADGQPGAFEERIAFWRRHTMIGVALCVVLPALVLVRTAVLEDVPHRTLIVIAMAATIVLSPLLLLVPTRAVVAHRRGRLVFDVWEAAGIAMVSVVAYLDGGATSPYVFFYFVLLAHAALAYPPVGMLIAGVLIVGSYLAVGVVAGGVTGLTLALVAASLLVAAGTCAVASYNHMVAFRRTASYAARLAALAERDGLTGCLNHRAFHQRLAAECARAGEQRPLTVLIVDVDRFKQVNDTRGHAAGDQVLQLVGAVLNDVSRGTDAPARLGGDEFALLLPACGTVEAMLAGDRLRGEISRRGAAHGVTVSVGAATTLAPCDPDRLLADADRALYAAKEAGRDITKHAGITATADAATLARAAAALRERRSSTPGHV